MVNLANVQIKEEGPTIPGGEGHYPGRIVLAHVPGEHMPWVTWLRVEPDGRDKMGTKPYFISGHYFFDEERAKADFDERVRTGY